MSSKQVCSPCLFLKLCCILIIVLPNVACSLVGALIHPIPELRFEVDSSKSDHQIEIVSMSNGSISRREENAASASVGTGVTAIKFRVTGDGQESEFEAEMRVERSFKGAGWRIARLSQFSGSMWLPEQDHDVFVFSGSHALRDSFLVGRTRTIPIGINDGIPTVVREQEPGTVASLGPESSGMVCKGEKGASLLVVLEHRWPDEDRDAIELRAPPGSSVHLSQDSDTREIRIDKSGQARSPCGQGELEIKWFPAGAVRAEIEVVIDRPSIQNKYILSFSSCLL